MSELNAAIERMLFTVEHPRTAVPVEDVSSRDTNADIKTVCDAAYRAAARKRQARNASEKVSLCIPTTHREIWQFYIRQAGFGMGYVLTQLMHRLLKQWRCGNECHALHCRIAQRNTAHAERGEIEREAGHPQIEGLQGPVG